jgi:hypothetical protein
MRWFHWPVEVYENIRNPYNGEVLRMSCKEGKWHLDAQLRHKQVEEKKSEKT